MADAEKVLDLIKQAQKGNKSAMNTLLVESYSILRGYLLKLTGDNELTQDIVQETMLKAVLNISKFDPRAKFSTWLVTIGTNVFRDMLRKKKSLVQLEENLSTHTNEVEERALSNIQLEEIKKLLFELSNEKRAVFVLKHYYGYKYEEIAEIVGCPIGTVRSRLHNAVKFLVTELERRDIVYEKK